MAILSISFATLKANYYIGKTTPDFIKGHIGGGVNASYINNTCVIKVSKALNASSASAIPAHRYGLVTVVGQDKKNYALRVKEFKIYLLSKYGKPDLTYNKSNPNAKQPEDFNGKTGIIIFDVQGWSDATGHATLWDNNKCLDDSDYWNMAKVVELWIVN